MKTKRQEELTASFLSALGEDERPLFAEITAALAGLGCRPRKERSYLVYKHSLHNKQIAKTGFKKNETPYLALRFSACRGVPEKFDAVVREAVLKYPTRAPRCPDGLCSFCRGEPGTHIYTCTLPDGSTGTHCGAYALEVPVLTPADAGAVIELIRQEHDYLMRHEAGAEE